MNDQSRVALVTGASRGIGRAVALALADAGVHVIALARTQGALEELDDEIRALRPGERDARDAGSLRFARLCRDRPPRRGDFQAMGPPRRAGRQCRPARARCRRCIMSIPSPGTRCWPSTSPPIGGSFGRSIRCLRASKRRPRRVSLFRRRASQPVAGLLGPLCRFESRARRACPHLCRRNRQHFGNPRHAGQSRPVAHPDARRGYAGRRPADVAHARGAGAENRRNVLSALAGNRQDSTISRRIAVLSFRGPE